jgi:hypothetical protein
MKACCAKEVLIEREACAEQAFKSSGVTADEIGSDLESRPAPVVEPDEERKLMQAVVDAAREKSIGECHEFTADELVDFFDYALAALDAYRAKAGK